MDEGDLLPARQVAEKEEPDPGPPPESVPLGLEPQEGEAAILARVKQKRDKHWSR